MTLFASVLFFALSRAEIIERMRAPVIRQADGLVQVFADCPADMRQEYQMPIASFASDTVNRLYRGLGRRPKRFTSAGILIHVGDVRTNLTTVLSAVSTNRSQITTRIYVRSPGWADLSQLRMEIVKAFFRSVEGRELADAEAWSAYRRSDPASRVADERAWFEDWWSGRLCGDDERGLTLIHRILEPGRARPRDVLIFASRLFLYPPQFDVRFLDRFDCLSFRDALKFARIDPRIRVMATIKANEMPVFGGGRGEALSAAADAYRNFLLELGKLEKDDRELARMLDDADEKLNIALEEASK